MRHPRLTAVLAAVVMSAWLPTMTTGLAATQSIVGSGGWSAIVSIPLYPCPACALTFTGKFAGSMTVLDSSGHPTYTATWVPGTADNLSTGPISYSESCGTVPLYPDSGTAGGSFTISGGILTLGGTVVGTATLTGTLSETRTTALLLLNVTGVSLLNGSSVVASTSGVGVGVGIFGGPVPSAGSLPPSCINEESATALVVGTYTQPN